MPRLVLDSARGQAHHVPACCRVVLGRWDKLSTLEHPTVITVRPDSPDRVSKCLQCLHTRDPGGAGASGRLSGEGMTSSYCIRTGVSSTPQMRGVVSGMCREPQDPVPRQIVDHTGSLAGAGRVKMAKTGICGVPRRWRTPSQLQHGEGEGLPTMLSLNGPAVFALEKLEAVRTARRQCSTSSRTGDSSVEVASASVVLCLCFPFLVFFFSHSQMAQGPPTSNMSSNLR